MSNTRKPLIALAALLLPASLLVSCSIPPISCGLVNGNGVTAGVAPANSSLFEAIKAVAAGHPKLAMTMLMGTHIESGWLNFADTSDGGVGDYRIQLPGVVHTDITRAQALDPAYATNYMLPAYQKALTSVSDTIWAFSPVEAAELVVIRAEKPARPYHEGKNGQQRVNASYQAALKELKILGFSDDFGATGLNVVAPQDPSANCASAAIDPLGGTNTNDPGPGPQDANASGVFFNLRPRTTKLVKFAQANYDCGVIKPPGCIHGYGGWRPYDPVPDHPDGRATDFTISTQIGSLPNPAELQFGWSLACSLQTHASEFGIQYMIWQGQIFNVARSDEGGPGGCGGVTRGWRDYCSGGSCGPYGNTTSPTQLHLDHVHVTLKP